MTACKKSSEHKITCTKNAKHSEGIFLNTAEAAANSKPQRKQITIDKNESLCDNDKETYNHDQRSKQRSDDDDGSLDNGGNGDDKTCDRRDLVNRQRCHCCRRVLLTVTVTASAAAAAASALTFILLVAILCVAVFSDCFCADVLSACNCGTDVVLSSSPQSSEQRSHFVERLCPRLHPQRARRTDLASGTGTG